MFRNLQRNLQKVQQAQRFGGAGRPGAGPPTPGKLLGGGALLVAGLGGAWFFNNALFNGEQKWLTIL